MDNRLKTTLLLALLTALALWIGQFWGTSGMIVAAVIVVAMNFGMYFFSDKMALGMYRAQPASKSDYRELHALVQETAQQAQIPTPDIYIIDSAQSNAFATGRNPENGKVAVTKGILQVLNKNELKGVIAHELAHIKNRDILITTIAATIGGIISYVATMAQWAAIFGGLGGRDGEGGGIIQLLVMIIVAPLIATVLRMAISRSREYLADQKGAEFINDPHSLADALEKIERHAQQTPMRGPQGAEALFIINPFSKQGLTKLFSTHPPTQERTKRLRSMRV